MAALFASSIVAVTFNKCSHSDEKKLIKNIPHSKLLSEIFHESHSQCMTDDKTLTFTVKCKTNIDKTDSFEIEGGMSFGTLAERFNIKCLEFTCTHSNTEDEKDVVRDILKDTNRKAVDAFKLLMAGGRRLFKKRKTSSSGMKDGLSRKDELFNDLVGDFENQGLDWPSSQVSIEGAYFIQVLCNALWYLTNHHEVINDTAHRSRDVKPIPEVFSRYSGYNDMKRKKMKGQQMSQSDLASHSRALYSLLMKPVVKSTPAWSKAFIDIRNLADCMDSYKNYLNEKLETQTENQRQTHPCKPISENATVEHKKKVDFIASRYSCIDQVMREADDMSPVFFDETVHLEHQFEDSKQRSRYFENLCLTVPVYIIRFCPGGSRITTSCLFKCSGNPPEAQILIEGARLLQKIQSRLEEVHTRAQKREFKDKINLITTITPAVRDFIYSHLTSDGSASSNPEMQERLRLISLGNTEIVDDLRHLNSGRPKAFEPFFDKLEEVIEEVTAADERRHNIAHLSQWFSVEELIESTKARLPEGTAVPSASSVRLQFAPRNPYTRTALSFTSRLNVQYKVQRRQLRVSHQDQHYCSAILKYFKHMAVEQKDAKPVVLFCDDKAKVPVGEPGAPVSTGVRGKKTLAPTGTTLSALDHDMTKASITPSVYLRCNVPDTVDKSFVQGAVTTVTNDSVFETSSPFRHAATICKMLENEHPKIVMKFTDGGTDQRNNLESVKCANICMFKELNLDMLVHARCAPGHSWTNPAERIMSVLNLALQNCSLEREKLGEEVEREFQKCGSMAQLREIAAKKPEMKNQWKESIEPVQATIRNRFLRLKLKDEPFKAIDPMMETDIDVMKRHLRELFPTMDCDKLQKVHTNKIQEYADWMSRHSRQCHYIFQLKKCQDADCCIPGENRDMPWLPDPILDETGEHYYQYDVAKTMETSEACRPSLKLNKQTKKTKSSVSQRQTMHDSTQSDEQHTEESTQQDIQDPGNSQNTSLYTTQYARALVTCVECRKPRVIYSKQRLNERTKLSLAIALSEIDFVCGSPITNPSSKLAVSCRPCECASPVEIPYYGSALGPNDVCALCGNSGGEVDQDLKLKYKTVLPLCNSCKLNGLKPIVFRPYGKKK